MAKKSNTYKPDWVPENAGKEFATSVVKGVNPKDIKKSDKPVKSRKHLDIDDYVNGVLANDRVVLARTITLIESNSHIHNETAQKVLKKILPDTGKSLRIGITGVPGAGKSTFIESLGLYLISKGHKVAVLAIDPSSTITKGSILGDKTRMENLARQENCFIRPSPSGGTLGGVARKTRETMLVCEAAGYDVILIETVGVGQSETTVRSMVDFFLLLMIAGAGDELQGIKKGVIELADALLINKADGDNKQKALLAKTDFSMALHYIQHATRGWKTEAHICSALNGEGITEIWNEIMKFRDITKENGVFYERRKSQTIEWMNKMIEEKLLSGFYDNNVIRKELDIISAKVLRGDILPPAAAEMLLEVYKLERKK
ncbi:MAG TPA: methylmalonyl Co-A mutase-associated GTPase MeaB [Ignavibacteria bacterium]|nr:methylmalonyl Co-A mutase-associated GTPase MeaB [Ignavibacteria bacterium]